MATQDLTDPEYWDNFHRPHKRNRWGQQASNWLNRRFRRFLRETLAPIPGRQAKVLELGCAPGTQLLQLHSLRPEHSYEGIDYAEDATRATRANVEGLGIKIHLGDLHTLELDTLFDYVVSFGLIEHFEDPTSVLAGHARFCRPGGLVLATIPNLATPVNRLFARAFAPETLAAHNLELMNTNALARSFQEAGLEDVETGACTGAFALAHFERRRRLAWAIKLAAKSWNATATFLPMDALWSYRLYGLGRVPLITAPLRRNQSDQASI